MFDEVDENGSNEGLTWRSKLKDIDEGSFIAILGPKGTQNSGIIAVGEAKGPVFVGPGRDENIVMSRHKVFLRRVSLSISTVEEILGTNIEVAIQPPRPGDQSRTKANIDKARKILGYNPQTSLKTGLEAQVAWFKAQFM